MIIFGTYTLSVFVYSSLVRIKGSITNYKDQETDLF